MRGSFHRPERNAAAHSGHFTTFSRSVLSDDQPKIEIGNRAGRNHILGTTALPFNALLVTALPRPTHDDAVHAPALTKDDPVVLA